MRSLLQKHVKYRLKFFTYAHKNKWNAYLGFEKNHIYVYEAHNFHNEGGIVQQRAVMNLIARKMKLMYADAEAWMINSR